jgi:hypothetical protein
MFKKVFDLFIKVDKPKLGRWSLKSCNEISTSINSVYQNRDHCGDTICKTPKKASEYKDLKECPDSKVNAPVHETTHPT